jgi:hypothetical protein
VRALVEADRPKLVEEGIAKEADHMVPGIHRRMEYDPSQQDQMDGPSISL